MSSLQKASYEAAYNVLTVWTQNTLNHTAVCWTITLNQELRIQVSAHCSNTNANKNTQTFPIVYNSSTVKHYNNKDHVLSEK